MIITAYRLENQCRPVFLLIIGPSSLSEHHPSAEPFVWDSLRAPSPEEGEDSGLHKSPTAA